MQAPQHAAWSQHPPTPYPCSEGNASPNKLNPTVQWRGFLATKSYLQTAAIELSSKKVSAPKFYI